MKYLLGVDLGTSGTKTVLFDEKLSVIASDLAEYPLIQIKNGYAEQNPADWWNAVCSTIKNVVKTAGVSSCDVAGIGISGQMHGLVMLDEDGEVLRNSIIWCDGRTEKQCDEITKTIGKERLIELTANPALTGFTLGKILWVRENEPQIYAKCKHILLPKDYIRYKLTGVFATEVSDASGMNLLDINSRDWCDEIIEKLSLDKNMFAKVYESTEITGYVCGQGAVETGLSSGEITAVVGGAGDNAAAAVGMGVVRDKTAFTTIGTSGVVFAQTDKASVDKLGRVHTFCAAVPKKYTVMSCTLAAGLSLKWFRDNFCEVEIDKAEKDGVDPYFIMDKLAENSPIGANRLLYLPYLMGERSPILDSKARGTFVGLSAMHEKKDLIRSVLEGVIFSQKQCLDVLSEMDVLPEDMLACGGGAVSPLWRQIMSDVYNMPVKTIVNKDAPSLGVAILAAVGTGIFSSVEDACDSVIKSNKTVNPVKENHEEYLKYFEIYKKVYPALKDVYKDICDLG